MEPKKVDIIKIIKVLQQHKYKDLSIDPRHIELVCIQTTCHVDKRVIKYFIINHYNVVDTIMNMTDQNIHSSNSDCEYDDDEDEIDWSKLKLPPIIV